MGLKCVLYCSHKPPSAVDDCTGASGPAVSGGCGVHNIHTQEEVQVPVKVKAPLEVKVSFRII